MLNEKHVVETKTGGRPLNVSPSTRHQFMGRFSISAKLIAGFAAIASIALTVGVTGLYFVSRISVTLNDITDVAAPTVEMSDDPIAYIHEATKVAEEALADEDIEDLDPLVLEFGDLDKSFDKSVVQLQGLITDEALMMQLVIAQDLQEQFTLNAISMISAHRQSLERKAAGLKLLQRFDEVGAELIIALDEFAEENANEMAEAEEEGDRLEQGGASGAVINNVLGQLFDQDYPVVESALKAQRLVVEMQDTAGEFLAEEGAANLPKIEEEFRSLNESVWPHLQVLASLAETEEDTADASRLRSLVGKWTEIAYGDDQLFETHRKMLDAEASKDRLTELMEAGADTIAVALGKVAAKADAFSDGADRAAVGAVSQAQTAIISLLILAMSGSLGLLWIVVATVVRPIRHLTNDMVSFGERYGQAPMSSDAAGDEISQLRLAFDHLEAQVQQRTEDLQRRTLELDGANSDLQHELEARRAIEQQLVRTQKLEGLGTLAGGIAHDFNNMLYVILGCSKMALEELPAGSSVTPLIEKIDQAAQRSSSIVNQILFFSRQETPDRQPVNAALVVQEAVMLLRAGLPSSLKLDIDIDEECGTVLGDETQIQQVTVNLVTNAFQAHDGAKGTVGLSVKQIDVDDVFAARHVSLSPGVHVCIAVADEGGGIPDDIAMKIFDPFFTTKPVGEGTGLGLAVVHGIVTAHKGTVVVDTKIGQGTRFEVYLPTAESTEFEKQGETSAVRATTAT